jgi:hypothetical protein
VERQKENVLNDDVMLSAHFSLSSPNKQKHHQEKFARTPITSASPELQRPEVMRKIEIDAEIHLPPPTDFIVSSSNSSPTDTFIVGRIIHYRYGFWNSFLDFGINIVVECRIIRKQRKHYHIDKKRDSF